MNDQDYSERKHFRREKFTNNKKGKRKDYSEDYEAHKNFKRDFKNRKREIEDLESMEDLDEYQ